MKITLQDVSMFDLFDPIRKEKRNSQLRFCFDCGHMTSNHKSFFFFFFFPFSFFSSLSFSKDSERWQEWQEW